MSASQDAALIVGNNLPDSDSAPYDDFSEDDDSEDPAGRGGGQGRHHHPQHTKASQLRPSERGPVTAPKRPALLAPDLAAPRMPLQRLTVATRSRDRDILRGNR